MRKSAYAIFVLSVKTRKESVVKRIKNEYYRYMIKAILLKLFNFTG